MVLIFDNQCPPNLAKGLNLLEDGNRKSPIKATVKHIRDITDEDATDEEIIKHVGKHKGIIITLDKDFKYHKHYYQLYKEYNVGVVFYRSTKGFNYWEIVKYFINSWDIMKSKIKDEIKPFAFEMTKKGITKLSF